MIKGDIVKVRIYGGEIVERRFVADKRRVIVVCAEKEYQCALEEGREPTGMGFPRADVLIDLSATGISE